jgi:type IV secretion system protein VirD4
VIKKLTENRKGDLFFEKENEVGKFFLGVVGADIGKTEAKGKASLFTEPVTEKGRLIGTLDDRHIVTVAGSRAGKGRSAIIPNLLTYPGSMVVIDPKGDLARITAARRRRMKHTVHVLDPFNASGLGNGDTYNPMRSLRDGSPTLVEDAGSIADAIVMRNPDTKDPHWDESAFRLIETLILHVATRPDMKLPRDLCTVSQYLSQINDTNVEAALKGSKHAAVKDGANDFYQRPVNERSSVLSTARRHARFLSYDSMQTVLRDTEGALDLADLKTKRTTVYLVMPAMRMGTCARWLRLFVNMALAKMEEIPAAPEFPIIFCLDEFAVLGHMKTIEDAAGQLAGLGVKLWPILQDLTQLQALYGKRWETFLGNAGVLQFFGNSDQTTLEWISKRLGEFMISTKSVSQVDVATKAGGNTGESVSQSVHPLMTPEEISRFFGRDDGELRQLIIRPSKRPLVLQRVCYDKQFADIDPEFKALLEEENKRGERVLASPPPELSEAIEEESTYARIQRRKAQAGNQ